MTVVCITGMHRSGTSMVARLLNLCGLYLGHEDDFLPSNTYNADGYWEHIQFVEINDTILSNFNGAWNRPPESPINSSQIPTILKERAQSLLQSFRDHKIWGWKDPRNSVTMPFWQELIPDLKVIICLRNPLEVADSLTYRDGFSKRFGLDLWQTYNQRLLSASSPENRIITHYNTFFSNPTAELRRLLDFIGLSTDELLIQKACMSSAPSLRHNQSSLESLIALAGSLEIVNLYVEMCAAAGPTYWNTFVNHLENEAGLHVSGETERRLFIGMFEKDLVTQSLAAHLSEKENLIQSLYVHRAEQDNEISSLTQKVLDKDSQITAWKQVVVEKDKQLYDLMQTIAAWNQVARERERQLKEIFSSRSWQLIQFLQKIRHLTMVMPLKVFNFYRKNGLSLTISELRDRLLRKTRDKSLFYSRELFPYQYLLKKFPQRFSAFQTLDPGADDLNNIVDSAAQADLKGLLFQLDIAAEAQSVLSLIKSCYGEDQYLHLLDNIFTLEQFKSQSAENKTYDLIQASELREISKNRGRRRILFITSQFPNPQNGGGNRVMNFIKLLSEHNDIYLSTCFVPEDDEKALQAIQPYCCSIQQIPLWKFGGNQAEINKWLGGMTMDIVHYEWPRSLENYDPAYGKYQIFTYMEAVSLRLLMDLKKLEPLSKPWLIKLADIAHNLCTELVNTSPLNARIAVTTKDGDFFRALYPHQEYTVLNHGITFEDFSLPDVEPEPHTLVFVGNYQHSPNVDALDYFFREIWQAILSEIPDACIYIIGPKPPKEIKGYADGKRVIVTGAVADIRPYIQKGTVCIAPLITGAGMRGKVIDYAALRRTFVATSIATTDLAFRNEIDYFGANTASEFISSIKTLLKDPLRARQMGLAAYETARQNYDNRRLVNFLLNFYEYLETGPNV